MTYPASPNDARHQSRPARLRPVLGGCRGDRGRRGADRACRHPHLPLDARTFRSWRPQATARGAMPTPASTCSWRRLSRSSRRACSTCWCSARRSPGMFFDWIMGLATLAAVVYPFSTGAPLDQKAATAVVNLVLGIAITSLLDGGRGQGRPAPGAAVATRRAAATPTARATAPGRSTRTSRATRPSQATGAARATCPSSAARADPADQRAAPPRLRAAGSVAAVLSDHRGDAGPGEALRRLRQALPASLGRWRSCGRTRLTSPRGTSTGSPGCSPA